MGEAIAGLVLGGGGALGVIGLFSVCVQAFDMLEIAGTQDRTLWVLATKLDNQKGTLHDLGRVSRSRQAEWTGPETRQPYCLDSCSPDMPNNL